MATSGDPVVAGIFAATPNSAVREAMLLGSRLESSWDPTAVGDQGTSFGPFQIHLPAHPGVTAAQAEDPAWAARFMEPAYSQGAAAQGDLWKSDPERAAEQAAFAAERPAVDYYTSDGVGVVNQDWAIVGQAMRGQPITSPPPGGNQTTSIWSWLNPSTWLNMGMSLINNLVTGIEHALLDVAAYAGAIAIGGGLVVIGFIKLAGSGSKQATEILGAAPPVLPAAVPA